MNTTLLRRIINATVADLGHKTKECMESVLIREGYVFGRQFRFEGVRAIWFADEEVVAFYGNNGQLLGARTVAAEPTMMKGAAS
jgi:hypothetical protein